MPRRIGRTVAISRRPRQRLSPLLIAAALAFGVVVPAEPAIAGTTMTVTTTADDLTTNGNCSLREAIQAANRDIRVDACPAGSGADTIVLPAGTYSLTIEGRFEDGGLTGDLDILDSLSLRGAGAASTTLRSGQFDGVLQVLGAQTTVTISGLTIADGNTGTERVDRGSGGLDNGGLSGVPGGTVTVVDSIIHNNFGTEGGIVNHGTMTLLNTTVAGNRGRFSGGGASNDGHLTVVNSSITGNGNPAGTGGGIMNRGELSVSNSTISGNDAFRGGGIASTGASVVLNNVTFSDNEGGALVGDATASNTILANSRVFDPPGPEPDCRGTLSSRGYNLIETVGDECTIVGDMSGVLVGHDPMLSALQNFGGPTLTHALLPGSPAIDAGSPARPGSTAQACVRADQRGIARPVDGNADGRAICDIGAFEAQGPSVPIAPMTTAAVTPPPNAAGWNSTDASVTFTATAQPGAPPVRDITVNYTGPVVDFTNTYKGSQTTTTLDDEGITTLTFFATDQASNPEQPHTLVIKIDKTRPRVVFQGNQGTYTVDRTVAISCLAIDPPGVDGTAGSGIASSTCRNVDAPAYVFGAGHHTLAASTKCSVP